MPPSCECHSSLHGADGCGAAVALRWKLQLKHVLAGEPDHIDLCEPCVGEWKAHHLIPVSLTRPPTLRDVCPSWPPDTT